MAAHNFYDGRLSELSRIYNNLIGKTFYGRYEVIHAPNPVTGLVHKVINCSMDKNFVKCASLIDAEISKLDPILLPVKWKGYMDHKIYMDPSSSLASSLTVFKVDQVPFIVGDFCFQEKEDRSFVCSLVLHSPPQ